MESLSDMPDTKLPLPEIEQLARTNEVPSSADEETLRTFLQNSQSLLSSIQDRVSMARTILSTLEAQQTVVRTAAKDTARILHPVRRLHFDILSEIFARVMDAEYGEALYTLHPAHPPWTLGQVCRSWRAAALSLPTLWSLINIRIPCRPQDEHRLKLVLSRTRGAELTVDLESSEPLTEPFTSAHQKLFNSSSRWTDAVFRTTPTVLSQIAPSLNLHRLKKIRLSMWRQAASLPSSPPSSLFHSSTHLQQVLLSDTRHLSDFPISGERITTFRAQSGAMDDHLHALEGMPNLRDVTLHINTTPSAWTRIVELKRLRILSLLDTDAQQGHAGTILSFLRISGLRKLVLDVNLGRLGVMRPAPEKLTWLKLVSNKFDMADPFKAFLENAQALKRVVVFLKEFGGGAFPVDLVQALECPQDGEGVLPKLKGIHFQGVLEEMDERAEGILLAFAVSRRRKGKAVVLEQLGIDMPLRCRSDLLETAWQALRQDGLAAPCTHTEHASCNPVK